MHLFSVIFTPLNTDWLKNNGHAPEDVVGGREGEGREGGRKTPTVAGPAKSRGFGLSINKSLAMLRHIQTQGGSLDSSLPPRECRDS